MVSMSCNNGEGISLRSSLAPPFSLIFYAFSSRLLSRLYLARSSLVKDAALISYLINRLGQNVTCSSGFFPWMILK
jgi:hypothetical protein